jgi:hypothetical protein
MYVIICGDFGGVWSKNKESNEETMDERTKEIMLIQMRALVSAKR